MADVTVDNGALADYVASAKGLSGGQIVQGVELVSATEGGARVDLAKAEDSAHTSGHFGIMALAVRKDTPAALAGTDGDYAPVEVDANGLMYVNVGAAIAAHRTTDSVGAALQMDALMQDVTPRLLNFASISAATSGDNILVTAQGVGLKIRVHQVFLIAAGTVSARFQSAVAGTYRTGALPLVANSGFVLPFSPVGWFETAANELLNLELSASVAVGGCLVYTVPN